MSLQFLGFDELRIDGEPDFAHVALYADLREVVASAGHRFAVLKSASRQPSWDRAVFLNLTFWHAADPVDVLVDRHIPADVIAHIAWHNLASGQLKREGAFSAEAMLFSEAIASAFDLYLVGRLIGVRPDADFLATQVPAMAQAAENAGIDAPHLEALLAEASANPENAFEHLRRLLFDAATTLLDCRDLGRAADELAALDRRRFGPLLHHYELSNWILYARAHGSSLGRDPLVRDMDAALRNAPVALDWLEQHWVRPAIVHAEVRGRTAAKRSKNPSGVSPVPGTNDAARTPTRRGHPR